MRDGGGTQASEWFKVPGDPRYSRVETIALGSQWERSLLADQDFWNFSVHTNLLRIGLKLQILIQQDWGGA